MYSQIYGGSLIALFLYLLSPLSAQDIVITEVLYNPASGNERVLLTNTTGSTIDISLWWFCARLSYRSLSSSTVSVVSGSLNIPAGGNVTLEFTTSYLNDAASDLGLYTSSLFANCADMVDFVQWGASFDIGGRESEAVEACLWVDGDFVATASQGGALHFDGANTGGECNNCGNDGSILTTLADLFNAPTTLPVEISNFKVTETRHYNELNWVTVSEINTSHFEVQRSLDGVFFNTLAQVPAQGHSQGGRHYSFVDGDVNHPIIYYRIRYVDNDGVSGYSSLEVVGGVNAREIVRIESPTLLSSVHDFILFDVQNNAPGTVLQIALYNALGTRVAGTTLLPDIGTEELCLPIQTGLSGWHVLVGTVEGKIVHTSPIVFNRG